MNDSAFDTGERSAFDSWYNGMVGFHINSERIINDLAGRKAKDLSPALRKWMVVCWNNALDAALSVESGDGWAIGLDKLKEPLDKTL